MKLGWICLPLPADKISPFKNEFLKYLYFLTTIKVSFFLPCLCSKIVDV